MINLLNLNKVHKELCENAFKLDSALRGWLDRQPLLKEESITDWFLDRFSLYTSKVNYYAYKRHEEAFYSGADWDWWILFKASVFKLRVQAKRVRPNSNHYNDLMRSNSHGLQIEKLLKSSKNDNFFPAYVFFGIAAGKNRCRGQLGDNSMAVAAALEIYSLINVERKKNISSFDLFSKSIPLPCLFCCPISIIDGGDFVNPRTVIDKYLRFGNENFNSVERDEFVPLKDQGYEKGIPDLIKNLSNPEIIDKSELIEQYFRKFEESSAVSIIEAV